jgi:hypothetical protein
MLERKLAGPVFVTLFPELTWIVGSNRQANGRLQCVPIARDQGIGLAGHSRCDDPFVIGIAQSKVDHLRRAGRPGRWANQQTDAAGALLVPVEQTLRADHVDPTAEHILMADRTA